MHARRAPANWLKFAPSTLLGLILLSGCASAPPVCPTPPKPASDLKTDLPPPGYFKRELDRILAPILTPRPSTP